MSYAAVVNRDSGYVMARTPAFVRAMLENAVHGDLTSLHMVPGAQVDAALQDAFAGRPRAVIVLGGDGTARTAADYARRTEVPIIPLPGGTMNLLPRRLYGEADPADSLRRALQGAPRRLDAGCAAGQLFFLSGFFGIAPNIARAREALRGVSSIEALPEAFGRAQQALRGMFGRGLTYRLGGYSTEHRAETLVVAIGSLDHVVTPSAPVIERSFEVIGVDVRNPAEFARLGFNALMQHWREDPGVDVTRTTDIVMRLSEDDPCAVLDGEPVELPIDVEVTYLRDAIPVFAPESG